MAPSSRRRRYLPQPPPTPVALTPRRLAVLTLVGEFGLLTLFQLARLLDSTPQPTRRAVRAASTGACSG